MKTLEQYLPLILVYLAVAAVWIGSCCYLCRCWRKCSDGHYIIRTRDDGAKGMADDTGHNAGL